MSDYPKIVCSEKTMMLRIDYAVHHRYGAVHGMRRHGNKIFKSD